MKSYSHCQSVKGKLGFRFFMLISVLFSIYYTINLIKDSRVIISISSTVNSFNHFCCYQPLLSLTVSGKFQFNNKIWNFVYLIWSLHEAHYMLYLIYSYNQHLSLTSSLSYRWGWKRFISRSLEWVSGRGKTQAQIQSH